MKGIDWGTLFNPYKDIVIDTGELEKEISEFMADDVTSKKGIYHYILTRQEKYLSRKSF